MRGAEGGSGGERRGGGRGGEGGSGGKRGGGWERGGEGKSGGGRGGSYCHGEADQVHLQLSVGGSRAGPHQN